MGEPVSAGPAVHNIIFRDKELKGNLKSGRGFTMTGPRQPKDMPGLLKFCLEATRSEDAPEQDPDRALQEMDPERKKWLEEALSTMAVDFIEQLGNGIKVLNSDTADLDEKEEVLDKLEDWLGNIDMAVNFHKIGGYSCLRNCLSCPHPSLRSGASHLIAEISQNNPYCQEKFVFEGFLDLLVEQLDQDSDEHCQVKALYAISCISRDEPVALAKFGQLGGWSVLVKAVQRDNPKLRIKGCFMISSASQVSGQVVKEMVDMGLVMQLAHILHLPFDNSHEHILSALLTLVKNSSQAREESRIENLGLVEVLVSRVKLLEDKEEFSECVEHSESILKLLQPDFVPTEDWQEVADWQSLPGGCHVKMDMETGKKMARKEDTADR